MDRRRQRLQPEKEAKENLVKNKPENPPSTNKPTSGKTLLGQSDESYCVECISGHTMTALTEMRHALDRFRTSNEMTDGVQEKVRNAVGELMGATYDIGNLSKADPKVREELNAILNEIRWIRKDAESVKGLTRGYGSLEDLEDLRNRILSIQNKAYEIYKYCPTCAIKRETKTEPKVEEKNPSFTEDECPDCSEAVGVGWGLGIAKRMNMPDADALERDVMEERISVKEAMKKIMDHAEKTGNKVELENLQEINRMMYTPLSELEKEP